MSDGLQEQLANCRRYADRRKLRRPGYMSGLHPRAYAGHREGARPTALARQPGAEFQVEHRDHHREH